MSTLINENIEVPKSTTFQTGVNIVVNKSKVTLPPLPSAHQKCPSFFDAVPPTYNPNSLSLPIPVDLFKIKKNATNSLTKVKFSHLLQNPQLNELVDALISDSFWFIVCFFKLNNSPRRVSSTNIIDSPTQNNSANSHPKTEQLNEISSILKRMSCNYFKFFIRVCDMGPSRKNDPVLNVFRDFMSQCVFYSIYLGFPKSRYLFNEEFRNRIVVLFAYLYNGLVSENNFASLHWELDLGKGNIIEPCVKYKDEPQLKLPDIAELQLLLENNYKKKNYDKNSRKKKYKNKKEEINSDILNTPLYRLYAETNKFETLNLVKPIKISNRRIIDIYQISKQHALYVKYAKDTLKNVAERKAQYEKEIAEKDAEFQNQIAEVKQNENRIKRELADIKIQRVQEYANYCIFISSK